MHLLYNLIKLKRGLEFKEPPVDGIFNDKEFLNRTKKNQKKGFADAKYMQASFLKDIEDIFEKEKETGTSYADLKKVIVEKLQNRGWLPNNKQVPSRVQLSIDNTIAVEHARFRFDQQMKTKDYYPFLRWRQQNRKNKRHDHQAFDGKIFSKDDPELLAIYPPKGFNCNCRLENVTEKEFNNKKLEISPVKDVLSDLSKSSNDYGGLDWKPNVNDFPKEIRDTLNKVYKEVEQVNNDTYVDKDFPELNNRIKFCSEEEFKASWGASEIQAMQMLLKGKFISKQDFVDVLVPKNIQTEELNKAILVKSFKNSVYFEYNDTKGININRIYQIDKNNVYNNYYVIPKGSQGQNYTKTYFLNQLALNRALGFDTMTTYANMEIGCWAWARYGYEFKDVKTKNSFYDNLKYEFSVLDKSKVSPELIDFVNTEKYNKLDLFDYIDLFESKGFDVELLKNIIISKKMGWDAVYKLNDKQQLKLGIKYATK